MTHTHFANPHGLEADDHYSCAQDLVLMGRYALQHYPFIAQAVTTRSTLAHVNGTEVTLSSTDAFMTSYPGGRGIKTGAYSEGYTFLGASERDNVQLYSCVLGCSTASGRFADTVSLMDWAYGHYRAFSPVASSAVVSLQPYPYNFNLKTVVSPTSDTAGLVWPNGSGIEYVSVRAKAGKMLDADSYAGVTTWTQDNRTVGWTILRTRPVPVEVSSWPPLALGLFCDTATLGTRG